ncbi:hypothetical protein A3C59_02770 [Candidatus Daviesbacteria bacterium RIFCSPHIGHO2_02_FULL_36_13]|uniref:Uncharacterized protein n=1 Tax=Candidatus Daviesbacteria bacterium RIFCSPHIGHO2_02_FULL_36_13 TaxID=1797768 RepID=A0A1F5JWH4_9BACT|nr:MAG: hypothetical protein A3C59_02770 [Candidatus Daviesbacteria bacterium RIFCSPHIGHO2_02_FULL_36_13]OGE44749.1 MAG: hypothetical protein A3A45_02805 [Candidatus Daviesbacteria bacterium RIFCSPLOWO2_01_FULL_36_8]
MPKPNNPKITLRLDLLRPQTSPEKILTRLIRWLLSSGRFILIFVEAVVLIAFITRFKLDADLQTDKEKIVLEQAPFIESQKSFEILIRETQLKLSTIGSLKSDRTDYPQILKKIADQTPAGVKLTTVNFEKSLDKISIRISAIAQNNSDLSSFIAGLKQDPIFSDINIGNITFSTGILNFTLEAQANKSGGTKL